MGQVLSYITCFICGKAEEEEWTNDEVQPLIWNSTGDAREIRLGNEQSSNVNIDCAFHYNPPYFQANSTTCSHSITRPELQQYPTIPFINVHSTSGSSMGPLSDSSTDDHAHASIALDIDTNFHVVYRAFSPPHLYTNGEELKEEEEERVCREGVLTSAWDSDSGSSIDDHVHAFTALDIDTNVHVVERAFSPPLLYSNNQGSSMDSLSDSSTNDHVHASIALDIDTNVHVVERALSPPHLYSNGEELKEEEEERVCREGLEVTSAWISSSASSMVSHSDSSSDDYVHQFIALGINTNDHVVECAFLPSHLYSNGEELKEVEEERFCREGVVTRNSDSRSSMESHSDSSSDDHVHAFIAFGTNKNVHAVEDTRHVFPQSLSYSSRRGPKEEEEERVSAGLISTSVWMGYYGSCHKILLVGEGDFSFSTSLARAFGSATNIIATSLDSIDFLRKNYSRAISNINELTRKGCTVRHKVDATEMAGYRSFEGMKFDRIIFNFPHAGFFSTEARDSQIRRHQTLLTSFFKNAMKMIYEDGEIHVTHKSNHGFHSEWNLEFLASMVGLRLVEEVPFNFIKYPGYRTKYGFGGDKNFNSHPSKTYMFGLKKRSPYRD